MISLSVFIGAELVAGAVLALWVAARYPRFGPKSLRSAMLVVGAAFLVMQVSSFGMTPLLSLPHGVYLTLFGYVLPTFFAGFLAAAWLMRVLAGQLGGSGGGGGGHRVPATSRS